MTLAGQWIGQLSGSNNGSAIADIDDNGTVFRGSACFFDDDASLPGTVATFETRDLSDSQTVEARISPINRMGDVLNISELPIQYPNTMHGVRADLVLRVVDGKLHIESKTDIGSIISGILSPSTSLQPSTIEVVQKVGTWREFRDEVLGLEFGRYIFRGQRDQKRLRTTFHRTNRSDLITYRDEDIPTLLHHVNATTQAKFSTDIPSDTGALLNLVRHHGYPTPILDWSKSPFVAAYFSYAKAKEGVEKVRIFRFDRKEWVRQVPQQYKIAFLQPHFSVAELPVINNVRALPQQAVATFTNVDDVEQHIQLYENHYSSSYIVAYDLPASDRDSALHDLTMMGISAASLFPGLDGVCETIRQQRFRD
tara:strand:- start:887 stop:1987 length:1101 start_codon:yes stop_codon:yes gene_type:complete